MFSKLLNKKLAGSISDEGFKEQLKAKKKQLAASRATHLGDK